MIHDCACRIPSPSLPTATLGHHERRVDEAFFFIQRTSVAKLVSNDFLASATCLIGTRPALFGG
jgi:hypothetical protein